MIVKSLAKSLKIPSEAYGSQPYKIKGKLLKNNNAVQGLVRCYEKSSGVFLKQTISGENGDYQFENLSKNYKYFVIAHNLQNEFNAVIQDNVVPK